MSYKQSFLALSLPAYHFPLDLPSIKGDHNYLGMRTILCYTLRYTSYTQKERVKLSGVALIIQSITSNAYNIQ